MTPETSSSLEISPAAATLAESLRANPFRFDKELPASAHALNIAALAGEADRSLLRGAVAMVCLGAYCRETKLALKLGGDKGFAAWLAQAVPQVPYDKVRVAMRVAGETFAKQPELYDLGDAEKVERVAALVDGLSFNEYAQSVGAVRRPANVNPETGKRLNFPAKQTPEARIEEAPERAAANWLAAFDTLCRETELGNFSHLKDEEAETYHALLGDLHRKLFDEVIAPRRAAAKTARPLKRI